MKNLQEKMTKLQNEVRQENKAKLEAQREKMRPFIERANSHMLKKYGSKFPTGVPMVEKINFWL